MPFTPDSATTAAAKIRCDTPSQSLRTTNGGLLPEYGERRAASQTPDGKAPPMSESYN